MALNKNQLKQEIIQILTDMMQREHNSIDEFADRLATAVDNYVKQATIVYENGLVSPMGAVTGTFNGHLE
jgi:hypothetical protein